VADGSAHATVTVSSKLRGRSKLRRRWPAVR
jgi:hypothetical protein